jgi:hypothetical protein
MSGVASLFAALALVPVMGGPIGSSKGHAVEIALCSGGILIVPLRGGQDEVPGQMPLSKGCHSGGDCRKRSGNVRGGLLSGDPL